MIFCNKMDKIGADFYRSVEMVKSRLGADPVVVQLPIGAENRFRRRRRSHRDESVLVWKSENLGAEWDILEIPADLKDRAEEYREKMIEQAVEMDEGAMERYLEGRDAFQRRDPCAHPQGHQSWSRDVPDVLRFGLPRTRAVQRFFMVWSTFLAVACGRFRHQRHRIPRPSRRIIRKSSETTRPVFPCLAFKIH